MAGPRRSAAGGPLGRLARVAAAIALLSGPVAAQNPAVRPELADIEFKGPRAFPDAVLRAAIISTASRCKLFQPLCALGIGRERQELDPLALNSDILRLRVFYYERGYRSAQVDLDTVRTAPDVMRATFTIDAGPPVLVTSIDLSGLDQLDSVARTRMSTALRALPLTVGDPLSLISSEAARDSLINRLQTLGYARGDVFVSYLIPRDSALSAHVTYELAPGERVYFGAPQISGNVKVSSGVIRRMLAFRRGDRYSREAILRSQRNLFGLDVFRAVEIVTDLAAPGDTVIPIVEVGEGALNRYRVGAGVSTAEFINVEGRWIARDFLGGARRLELRGRVGNFGAASLGNIRPFEDVDEPYDRLSYSLNLDVTQPWFFDPANSLGAGLFVERRSIPDVFVRTARGGYAAVSRVLGAGTSVTLGYRPELTDLNADDLIFCVSFTTCEAADIQVLRDPHWLAPLTVSFVRDRSNSLLAPTRGQVLRLEAEYAASAVGSDFGYTRLIGEWITYHEPFRGLVLATRVRPGWATSTNEPGAGLGLHPQKRFFAGGASSVRGFGQYRLGPKLLKIDATPYLVDDTLGFEGCEAQAINDGDCDVSALADSLPGRFDVRPVGGGAAFEGNLELRFPILNQKVRGAAFIDFGQVWETREAFRLSDLVWSPGVGLRYFSAIGPIRIDVGYNPQGVEQLTVLTTKVCERESANCDPASIQPGRTYTSDELRNSRILTQLDKVAFGANRSFFDRLQLHFSIGQAF
ncbi:MAG TPA: BamA/TamA family outer membrane protein [Longimicrobiales bacterium]|nr:BamA/TamA family outer membrane protein [Longimicrobiales bacterium]